MLAYHSVERDVLNVLNVYKKIKIQNVTQTNFMAKCNQTKVEDETEKRKHTLGVKQKKGVIVIILMHEMSYRR